MTVGSLHERAQALADYTRDEIVGCTRCELCNTRTQVVPGNGDPGARLMFVGEAPGYHEDRQGIPFCGAAGNLLNELLEGIGLTREDVFVANVLKCRPPGNRDPQPHEIAECERHLFRQVALIRPAMICALGNFATKLLSGRPDGISRVHGCELPITVAGVDLLLYPIYHPAAALRVHSLRQVLADDIARIPSLLGSVTPDGGAPRPPATEAEAQAGDAPSAADAARSAADDGPEPAPGAVAAPQDAPPRDAEPTQLGLF